MKHMKRITALVLALCMAVALVSCGESGGGQPSNSGAGSNTAAPGAAGGSVEGGLTEAERAKEFVTVATGPTSGIYFPIGGAFATALKDWGYTTSAQSTAASGENIQLIQEGGAEIAIAMQDSVMQAYEGFGAYEGKEPASELRALMRLWPNYVQLATSYDMVIVPIDGAGRDALISKYPFYASTTIPADTYNNSDIQLPLHPGAEKWWSDHGFTK